MPYMICADCSLLTYSAALWATTEECPRCGTLLPTADRAAWLSLTAALGDLRGRHDDAPGGEHA